MSCFDHLAGDFVAQYHPDRRGRPAPHHMLVAATDNASKIDYPHQEGNNARPDRYLTAKWRCQFPMVDCFHSRSLEARVGIGQISPLLHL
jgi:hypothetical protein